jgi:hypothetical protein
MLVDITIKRDRVMELLSSITGDATPTRNLGKGLYIANLNFDGIIVEPVEQFFAMDKDGNVDTNGHWRDGPEFNSYGVCDSPEQFMKRFGDLLVKSPREICVAFTPMRRSEQPKNGGWRWGKWGPYIGNQKPSREYIADEPDIEEVYCYHAYLVVQRSATEIALKPDVA